jgi:putative membrane protein insertion efficiency factor
MSPSAASTAVAESLQHGGVRLGETSGVPVRPGVVARMLMGPIRAWRLVSIHLPPRCRFHPSCSQYALEALTVHGAFRGTGLAIRRVSRCHPWHDGGLDPVPPRTARHPNVRSHSAATPRGGGKLIR